LRDVGYARSVGRSRRHARSDHWLHVHSQDGIIHVESPTARTYTLGRPFEIWHQPLSADQVGPCAGTSSVFVSRRSVHANPADMTLRFHEAIKTDAGTPVIAPQKIGWVGVRLQLTEVPGAMRHPEFGLARGKFAITVAPRPIRASHGFGSRRQRLLMAGCFPTPHDRDYEVPWDLLPRLQASPCALPGVRIGCPPQP
jgi:hypothetical protein